MYNKWKRFHYQRAVDKKKITSGHLLVFSVIGFIGASLGVLFDSFSIWPVVALDIVYQNKMIMKGRK